MEKFFIEFYADNNFDQVTAMKRLAETQGYTLNDYQAMECYFSIENAQVDFAKGNSEFLTEDHAIYAYFCAMAEDLTH